MGYAGIFIAGQLHDKFCTYYMVLREAGLGAHNSAAGSLLLCAVCPVKYLCRSFERPVGQEENHAGVRYAGGFNDPDCMESVKRRAS